MTLKSSLKYAILSLVVWFIALFLMVAGINTLIRYVFELFGWSNDVIYIVQIAVTLVMLCYYIFLIIRTIKDLKYIANNENKKTI